MAGTERKQGSGVPAGAAGPGPVQLLFQLALLVGLHVAGLALFTRGFMLTRVELPVLSSCGDYHAAQQSSSSCFPDAPSHAAQDSLSRPPQSQDSESQDSQNQAQNTLQSASADIDRDTHRGKACVQESPFDRVVILIIDAARYSRPLCKALNLQVLDILVSVSSTRFLKKFSTSLPAPSQLSASCILGGSQLHMPAT